MLQGWRDFLMLGVWRVGGVLEGRRDSLLLGIYVVRGLRWGRGDLVLLAGGERLDGDGLLVD